MSFSCESRKRPADLDGCTPAAKRNFNQHPETPLHPYMMAPPPHMFNPMMTDPQSSATYMEQMPFFMSNQLAAPGSFAMTPQTPSEQSCVSTPSTNDSGVVSEGSPVDSSPDEVFCHVQGRLNLVSNLRQYKVTKSEVLRRIRGPEYMNSSSLAALLRKAKTKDGGQELRQQLVRHGVHLPTNRRKGTGNTAFSALVEEEAVNLACDLEKTIEKDFPMFPLIQHFNNMPMTNEQREERKRDLLGMCRIMGDVTGLLHHINVPLAGSNPEQKPVDFMLQKSMEHFSLLTHGFGIINQRTWAKTFEQFAARSYMCLEQQAALAAANPQVMPIQWQL